MILPAHGPEPVEGGNAVRRGPRAVGDAARADLGEAVADVRAELDRAFRQPADGRTTLQGRRAAEVLDSELDPVVVLEGQGLRERPVEIGLRPGAQVGGQRPGAGHRVQALAGRQPRHLQRQARARAVQPGEANRLAGEGVRGIAPDVRRLARMRRPTGRMDPDPARPLSCGDDLAPRPPALEAEHGIGREQPLPRRGHRDDLQQAELPRAARHQARHVGGHGEPALHVGDAGPVAAVAVDAEGSGRRRARREDRVMVAEEADVRAAATLERRVQVEPRLVRHELGVEPVALERLGERAGKRVQQLVVTARRVLVDPVLQVCQEERKVRLCG